jgi:hypothetical protein
MRMLIPDVFDNLRDLGRADGKGGIAALPTELASTWLSTDPSARNGLQLLNDFCR